MTKQEKLIREYYASHGIKHGATLLFSWVRKSTTGGDWAVVEYWAAKYCHVKGKKGKGIVSKKVATFNPDTMRHSFSDEVISYSTWSRIIPDHLIYDFRRETGIGKYYGGIPVGTGKLKNSGRWNNCVMPTSEIPLNDFSGTKYAYCKYAFKDTEISTSNVHSYAYWRKNPFGNLPDYLVKFNLNPRAMEMFASRDLVKFMKEDFLKRLARDEPFAKWYKKHALTTLDKSITQIQAMARKEIGKTDFERIRDDERRRERARKRRSQAQRMAYMARMERKRMEEARKMAAKERRMRSLRIANLYRKLKSICAKYGAYDVIVPKTAREFAFEGKKMHNCVGGFASQQGLNSIVVFFWKNGKPCVDVEIDAKTFSVVQCRAVCNKDADESAHRLAEEIARKIKAIYGKAA